MRILITGSNGFLGDTLVKYIQEKYPPWKIAGFDIVETGQENYDFTKVNFNEKENWVPFFKKINPDLIFHLIGLFRGDNKLLYKTNTLSFLNFIEDLRIADVDAKLLIVGSAAQYGRINVEDNPIKETHNTDPISIYGLTKQHQEDIALLYNQNSGLDVVCTRPSSYIGKGLAESLFAGYLTRKFQSDKNSVNIEVSNRDDVRDYIDVRDVVRAMVKLQSCNNSSGEIVNISSGNPVSNIELIQNFEDITEKKAKINFTTPEKKVLAIWQDNSKIKELCDFTTKYTIKDSIKWCFSS